ncbi:MAG: phage head-tail connector protein [Rhizobiales bacterium]|nr:phage head-tail connector protein [Hyphomicrobiales bacterium]
MTAALITGPALEPVTLEEAKAHLRLDGEDDEAWLAQVIATARRHVESATRRVLIGQEWRLWLDAWPVSGVLRVPVVPLIAIDAITIYDADGEPHVAAPETYSVDKASIPARVRFETPPAPGLALNGIEIDLTAGYGDEADDVPSPLRHAILMLAAHWYEYRGLGETAEATTPAGFDALVAPYRVLKL